MDARCRDCRRQPYPEMDEWSYLIGMGLIAALAIASLFTVFASPANAQEPLKLHWDDADSGDLGTLKFRLKNVDAPETGGVDSAVGPALCEEERLLGLEAKQWIEKATSGKTVQILRRYNLSRGRRVVDMTFGGVDITLEGLASGYLMRHPHDDKGNALADKPDWCAIAKAKGIKAPAQASGSGRP